MLDTMSKQDIRMYTQSHTYGSEEYMRAAEALYEIELGERARAAFYGSNPSLMARVLTMHTYEMDGIRYQANSVSLAQVKDTVRNLDNMNFEERA